MHVKIENFLDYKGRSLMTPDQRKAILPLMPRLSHVSPTQTISTLSQRMRRVLAPNASAYTSTGTCTYIVGKGHVAVIDPGPENEQHLAQILDVIAHDTLTHILVTHTHKDHSSGALALQKATGALIMGCAPHHASRPLWSGEINRLEASGDLDYRPNTTLKTGDVIEGKDWTLEALETPGHTANHLCFALKEEKVLFSGDHVMGWSTSMIAPPDGDMRAYMNSLSLLQNRSETRYWPGHGGVVEQPERYVRAVLTHRRQREAAILAHLQRQEAFIPDIVDALYEGLSPALKKAAALTVFAHLESLVTQEIITVSQQQPSLESLYRTKG
jgi:glyoxylase-like metal-dependent hydrolase (beta-lactamase superfamily II)